MTIPAIQRGAINLPCPAKRCDYTHRFIETDLTIADKGTEERRLAFLRSHHEAGHPTKGAKPAQVMQQVVLRSLTYGLAMEDLTIALDKRARIAARICTAIKQTQDALK
jgi:hypothetical protein